MSFIRLMMPAFALATLLLPFAAQADCMSEWNYCMKTRCGPSAAYATNPKQTRCGAGCPCCAEYDACLTRPAPLPAAEIETLKEKAAICEAGAKTLEEKMYDMRRNRDPKVDFLPAYQAFQAKTKQACAEVKTYVRNHRDHWSLAAVVAAMDTYTLNPFEQIDFQGRRVFQYCPHRHRKSFDCTNAGRVMTSAAKALRRLSQAAAGL